MGKMFLGAALVLCLSAAVYATPTPLDLTVPHDPLVVADGFSVVYTLNGDGTGHLYAEAYPSSFNYGPGEDDYMQLDAEHSSWFQLNAELNTDGSFISGTLYVAGGPIEDPINYNPPTLFESQTLTAFTYKPERFEFTFTQNGDTDVVLDGAHLGVVLHTVSLTGDPETWFTDAYNGFSNNSNGQANVFYMPEPASLCLLAVGALGLLRRRVNR